MIIDFGDHAAVLDSTISLGALSATASVHTTAGLHREPGGTVTLAVDLEAMATIPDGTHRLWVNLGGFAGVDELDLPSGTRQATARIEDLLIILTPAEASRASVRLITRREAVGPPLVADFRAPVDNSREPE